MIGVNDRKALFSLAYIAAVAARGGYQVAQPTVDKDSVDGVLMGDEGRRPRIEFQSKATGRDILKLNHLAFPLPLKNYNDLRAEAIVPRLLIVVLLPENEADWLTHDENQLCLRRCGYWLSLARRPPVDNQATVTVQLPRQQVLDVQQLMCLMSRAGAGEPL